LPRGVDPKALYDQLGKFQNDKIAIQAQLAERKANSIPEDEPIDYASLGGFTESLKGLFEKAEHNPEIKTSIIKKLVHKVEVTPTGFEIHFHVGKSYYKRELGFTPSSPVFLFQQSGSTTLTNGGAGENRTRVRKRSTVKFYMRINTFRLNPRRDVARCANPPLTKSRICNASETADPILLIGAD
jgi:hypothetical protein